MEVNIDQPMTFAAGAAAAPRTSQLLDPQRQSLGLELRQGTVPDTGTSWWLKDHAEMQLLGYTMCPNNV